MLQRRYKAAENGYQHSRKVKEKTNWYTQRGQAKLGEEKYGVKRKGLTTVTEELKQRILAKTAKLS